MSLSRNDIYKYIYIICSFLFLMVISLIFNNYSHFGYFFVFHNIVIAGIVYISAYLDIYSGGIMSYILFYIYGSMTPLDPTLFGFIGVVSYAVSYILWRKISSDNFLSEILITFQVHLIYALPFS